MKPFQFSKLIPLAVLLLALMAPAGWCFFHPEFTPIIFIIQFWEIYLLVFAIVLILKSIFLDDGTAGK